MQDTKTANTPGIFLLPLTRLSLVSDFAFLISCFVCMYLFFFSLGPLSPGLGLTSGKSGLRIGYRTEARSKKNAWLLCEWVCLSCPPSHCLFGRGRLLMVEMVVEREASLLVKNTEIVSDFNIICRPSSNKWGSILEVYLRAALLEPPSPFIRVSTVQLADRPWHGRKNLSESIFGCVVWKHQAFAVLFLFPGW